MCKSLSAGEECLTRVQRSQDGELQCTEVLGALGSRMTIQSNQVPRECGQCASQRAKRASHASHVNQTCEACEADVRGMNKTCEACEA